MADQELENFIQQMENNMSTAYNTTYTSRPIATEPTIVTGQGLEAQINAANIPTYTTLTEAGLREAFEQLLEASYVGGSRTMYIYGTAGQMQRVSVWDDTYYFSVSYKGIRHNYDIECVVKDDVYEIKLPMKSGYYIFETKNRAEHKRELENAKHARFSKFKRIFSEETIN